MFNFFFSFFLLIFLFKLVTSKFILFRCWFNTVKLCKLVSYDVVSCGVFIMDGVRGVIFGKFVFCVGIFMKFG